MSPAPTRSLLALALAGLLFAAGAHAQGYAGTAPVDRIAAVVNEDVILRSELDQRGQITDVGKPIVRLDDGTYQFVEEEKEAKDLPSSW